MKDDIIRKLRAELNAGIKTEAQVVYFLSGIRKLLEQQNAKTQFKYLTFHCDWTLHPQLAGTTTQEILKQWDAANVHLRDGVQYSHLPSDLKREIDEISGMGYFEKELAGFLYINSLPSLEEQRPDGWVHFLHLYLMVVEDCPLVMKASNADATIDKVTVHVELAKEPQGTEMPYKIRWIISDRNGLTGEFFVINSFSLGLE